MLVSFRCEGIREVFIYYIYIFYFTIMAGMVEGCPDVRNVGKGEERFWRFRLRVAA